MRRRTAASVRSLIDHTSEQLRVSAPVFLAACCAAMRRAGAFFHVGLFREVLNSHSSKFALRAQVLRARVEWI